MIKAIRASCAPKDDTKSGVSCWYGQYRTIKFWHTVRGENGDVVRFHSKVAAMEGARAEWWQHINGTAATNRRRGMEARSHG
jgi:hypothetical protein